MPHPEEFSTHRLSSVLDRLDEIVFVIDVEDGPVYRYAAIFGTLLADLPGGRAHFVGQTVAEALPPAAAARAEEELARVVATGRPQEYEATHDLPSGRRTVVVRLWPHDGGTQVLGVVRDVTAVRAATREIARRDALNRAVLEAIPSATAVLDLHGVVRLTNGRWLQDIAEEGESVAVPGDDFFASARHLPEVLDATRRVLAGSSDGFDADLFDRGRWWNVRILPFELEGRLGAIVTRTDVNDRVEQHQQLGDMHQRWEAAFQSAAIGMCVIDEDGRRLLVNPKLCQMMGRTEEDLLGCDEAALTHPEEEPFRDQLAAERAADRRARGATGLEQRYLRPDGSTFWGWVTWSEVAQEDGSPLYFVQIQDVGPRKRAEARLADQRSLLELVATGTPLPQVLRAVADAGERHLHGTRWIVVAADTDGTPGHVSATGIVGAQADVVEDAYRTYGRTRWRYRSGVSVIPADGGTPLGAALELGGGWMLPVVADDGLVAGFVVVQGDLARRDPADMDLVEQLGSIVGVALQRDAAARHLAARLLEDGLTGLPSRSLFHRRAEQALARVGGGASGLAVLSIDLDRFGRVNESLGHLAGDHALVEVAARLQAAVPAADTVARGGGDQFLVLLEGMADADAALAVADRLAEELRRPLVVSGVEFACPASIGVAFCDDPAKAVEGIEGEAALAMAAAKARGRDRSHLFTEDLRRNQPRLTLERELVRAVNEKQFVVHFQPEVSLEERRIVGVEALVRWEHPERGLLPPADFIGAAEESGAVIGIGRQVLQQACSHLAEWSEDAPDLTVAVNLSGRQLSDPELVPFIRDTLQRHGIAPSRLVLEMTESTLVEDTDAAAAVFGALRELGVGVAIDDFGTGYSSLVYLKRFPADVLKIDRSFVDGLGSDPGDTAIVAAVVRLAHRLDLTVVAEGVETPEQVTHLRRLGCEQGQGHLWSGAVPADELAALLRTPLPHIAEADATDTDAAHERTELDELLAVLTHELSTPLTVIGGYAEMLAGRLDADSGARTDVAAIERNVHNLGRLVAALSNARGQGAEGAAVAFDLVAFVGQAVADLQPILDQHVVRLDATSRPAPVLADPIGVGQIITNLIGNAVKFCPPGTPVEVVVTVQHDQARVGVVDHGAGVPPDRVDELFGRFARLGSTRRGLGLGLYLSRAIARRHGGDIVHAATPGGGATFVLTLPLRTEGP